MLNKLLFLIPLFLIITQNIAQQSAVLDLGEKLSLESSIEIDEGINKGFLLVHLPFMYIGDELPLSSPSSKETGDGSKILAFFGMMHWVFIGIIVLGVLWGGIAKLFASKEN